MESRYVFLLTGDLESGVGVGGRQSSYFVSSPTKVVLTRAEKNGAATGGLKERETTSQHPGSSSPQITAQVTTQKWVKANLAGQRITKEVGLIN